MKKTKKRKTKSILDETLEINKDKKEDNSVMLIIMYSHSHSVLFFLLLYKTNHQRSSKNYILSGVTLVTRALESASVISVKKKIVQEKRIQHFSISMRLNLK